jgi:hypothetical protein
MWKRKAGTGLSGSRNGTIPVTSPALDLSSAFNSTKVSAQPTAGALLVARRRCCLAKEAASSVSEAASSVSEAAASLFWVFSSSFPRRQQARRLRRAAGRWAAAISAGALAVTAAGTRATALAGLLLVVMAALAVDARRWTRLAVRSGVGARSEGQVRRVLGGLEAEGWRVQHSLPWGRPGDVDSVAIAPTGIAFAIVFCPHLARR